MVASSGIRRPLGKAVVMTGQTAQPRSRRIARGLRVSPGPAFRCLALVNLAILGTGILLSQHFEQRFETTVADANAWSKGIDEIGSIGGTWIVGPPLSARGLVGWVGAG